MPSGSNTNSASSPVVEGTNAKAGISSTAFWVVVTPERRGDVGDPGDAVGRCMGLVLFLGQRLGYVGICFKAALQRTFIFIMPLYESCILQS